MVLIRNASFPGSRPGPPEPPQPKILRGVLGEIEAFRRERGISARCFEKAVGYNGLFGKLHESRVLHRTTIERIRQVMAEWPA